MEESLKVQVNFTKTYYETLELNPLEAQLFAMSNRCKTLSTDMTLDITKRMRYALDAKVFRDALHTMLRDQLTGKQGDITIVDVDDKFV